MAEFPAMPLWTDAYLADTLDLSLEDHGFYLLMLMLAWRRPDCALPNDMPWLKRSLSACCAGGVHGHTFNSHVPRLLDRFFQLADDGKWHQKRLDRERLYLRERSEKQRQTALKRWSKESQTEFKSVSNGPETNTCNEQNQLVAECKGTAPTPTPTPIVKERDSFGVQKESAPALPTPPPKLVRGSRIPDDWQPSEEELSYACSQGLTYHEAETMAVDFQQYWRAKAGKDAIKLDWGLTWQRWVRNSESFKAGNSSNGRQPYVSPKARIATELFYEMAREFTDGDENATRRNIREFTPKLVSLRPGS